MTDISENTPIPDGFHAVIHCDGSCPKNPGPMGIGFHIQILAHEDYPGPQEFGYRLGNGTNNRAEYLALIASLREALRQTITHVDVFCDSALVVNQVNGKWKCSDRSLEPLNEEAIALKGMFSEFKLSHIYREVNTRADFLSKNPTSENSLPSSIIEIDITTKRRRKLSRRQAAMIRWWWKTRRCRNEYRLNRIFGVTCSMLGRIGNGTKYPDITEDDMPGVVVKRKKWYEDIRCSKCDDKPGGCKQCNPPKPVTLCRMKAPPKKKLVTA